MVSSTSAFTPGGVGALGPPFHPWDEESRSGGCGVHPQPWRECKLKVTGPQLVPLTHTCTQANPLSTTGAHHTGTHAPSPSDTEILSPLTSFLAHTLDRHTDLTQKLRFAGHTCTGCTGGQTERVRPRQVQQTEGHLGPRAHLPGVAGAAQ